MQTTITKWGNSQGIRIPREICNTLSIEPGTKADIEVDISNSYLIVKFDRGPKKYTRNKKVSLEEFTKGWKGGKVGEEWSGDDVGEEVVR